ncbi:MAG: heat-inducible transcription repressor HrcA [Clostridia bacterium]|nr:heat-inducible transcription repressor HrcA [Clostridia bacterium]
MEERKKQVLNAIIKDYIANAEPVGSRAVSKKYDLGVSPATIRNEMSDLEEEGYIEQPHTSAGRIPSAKGYRYYVDNMMQREPLTSAQRHQVREIMSGEFSELDSFMRSCCNMISRLTNYTSIAAVPEQGRGNLLNLQLVSINEYQVLVILLASTGIVRHKLFELPLPINAEELARIEQKLRQYLVGAELKNISYDMLRERLYDFQRQDKLAEQAFDLLEQTLTGETAHKIFTGGIMNMLSQPEFQDIEKLRSMMSIIEDDPQVEKLLQTSDSDQLTVTIGGEMPVEGAQDCSMVVANYFVNGEKAGSLGVLGPTRLNYSRTVSLMEFIAGELSRTMSDKDKKSQE